MSEKKWVAGWGAAISTVGQTYADYIKDTTFRYVMFPTMNASKVRLHFSNEYGTETAVITKIFLAKRKSGELIDESTNTRVTFGGRSECVMVPGGTVISDEIDFDVHAGEEFDVSMYFANFTQLATGQSNNGYYIKKYYAKGDCADKEAMPFEGLAENEPYVFLNTIDFLTDAADDCKAIIAFGDSITAQPWPDCLAHRLYDLGIRNRSVIREGISGGRVLREYYVRFKAHFGVAGVKRFERDILKAGADRVIVLHGINDIIHPAVNSKICPMEFLPTVEELTGGLSKYIEIAHKHGMKIYLATIIPCPRCMNDDGIREEIRCGVNDWIRTKAPCDGVVDFEAAVWNEDDHKQIQVEYDSGDHLHPSFAGASHMADSIPLEFLK